MSLLNDRHQTQWENLGSYDPYWAVLSDPKKKGGKWDKVEFFESGHVEIEQVMENLARIHVEPSLGTALDFGCGVGRVSRALSRQFKRVIGIDISQSMLKEAREQHTDFPNIAFLHNISEDLESISSSTIDLVYSNIVLQHMPPERQLQFIVEFCRVLRPGGVAIFQTPSQHDFGTLIGWVHFLLGNNILNIARSAIYGTHGIMEIHTLAKSKIVATLETLRMSIAEIERYDSTGKGFVSYRYYAVKP